MPASELERLAAIGEFDPRKDLVWREGMSDWQPAHAVAELNLAAPDVASRAREPEEVNPYAAPRAEAPRPGSPAPGELEEIEPGSQPLVIGECIARGFDLTKRHFGTIIAVGAIYVGITMALGVVLGGIETAVGGGYQPGTDFQYDEETGEIIQPGSTGGSPLAITVSIITNLISHIVSLFLSLGVARIGLNLVSGQPVEIAMIFGEGQKLLRAFGAGILYMLMVGFGLILLIVPGIYLAMRFGQYQYAIVDRDMGVFEAFEYSSRITQNNRMSLFGLAILCFLIIIAGAIALLVGLIFAYPVAWLAGVVAYRWLQYGPAITRDVT